MLVMDSVSALWNDGCCESVGGPRCQVDADVVAGDQKNLKNLTLADCVRERLRC